MEDGQIGAISGDVVFLATGAHKHEVENAIRHPHLVVALHVRDIPMKSDTVMGLLVLVCLFHFDLHKYISI